jgi:transposase InsO family protein
LIHDRDTQFTEGFDQIPHGAGIEAINLPPQSPNLNAHAERWIRSLRCECLEHLILFGERSLAYVLHEYLAPHQ